MPDPYQVLGVSPTSTDDEIKQAYRKLVKKYHPDMHPGDKACEQKMKEINAAYDAIVNKEKYAKSERSPYGGPARGYNGSPTGGTAGNYGGANYGGGYTSSPFGGGGYGYDWPFGGYGTQTESPQMAAVKAQLDARNYESAINILDSIGDRTARWHYYYAMAANGLGDKATARDHAMRAVSMDPNNLEYRMYVESLGGSAPRNYTSVQSFGCGASLLKWVVVIIVFNLLLNLMISVLSGGRIF